ncbi:MAG: DsbA family oxidoreductase [Chitinophagaceae bacterium]|nr:DsbA family oxidoreductase [Chitinophagaceae bacterium]MCB9046466.1 DsbA family oxidoreductase [Chitinophagales bacterium]
MRVDIWSDVMCPFCYIGKRHFEAAMEKFGNKEDIEVVWHSFQLDPDTRPQPGKDVYTYLAERKGITKEQSMQMHERVVKMAAEAGLQYNFDKAVIANSFDAHRALQYAKEHGKGDAMEEQLFRGYFTEGKDISDHRVLEDMCAAIGLEDAKNILDSDRYTDAVESDVDAAAQLRISGVPFFVLNNKYGISGAQPVNTFSQALNQAWSEYAQEHPGLEIMGNDADTCEPGKDCN